MKHYAYVNWRGTGNTEALANPFEVDEQTLVIIDNNVCQHLVRFANARSSMDSVVNAKVEQLLTLCEDRKLRVGSYLGLLELSTEPSTGVVDRERYLSHESKIDKLLASRAIESIQPSDQFYDEFQYLAKVHALFETHLMKIKLLEKRGLKKTDAWRNITAYLEWCESLRLQTLYPQQVAYALFGGEPKARKVVAFQRGVSPLKTIRAAAWDLLYLFIVQQYLPLRENVGAALFATADEALGLIGSFFKLRGAVMSGGDVRGSVAEVSYDFPHFKGEDAKIRELQYQIYAAQARRAGGGVDEAAISAQRKELEEEVLNVFA